MSLSTLAFRFATIQALKGATYAGQNVLDEPVDPIEGVFTLDDQDQVAEMRHCIAVYTNISESKPDSSDIYGGRNWVELSIQMYCPFASGVEGVGATGDVKGRAGGSKLISDCMERQVEEVLLVGLTPWAKVRRRFQTGIETLRCQTFIMKTGAGADVTAREMTFRYEIIAPPPFGKPLPAVYQEFLALLDAGSVEHQAIAAVFRSAVGPSTGTDAFVAMGEIGVSLETIAAIGIGPFSPLPPDENPVPLLDEIDIVNEDGGGVNIVESP